MSRGTKGALLGILGFVIIVAVALLITASVQGQNIVELIRSWVA